MPEKVLVLVNTGTPDNPDEQSVSQYLSRFLNDPLVIDIPAILRKILVNYIIIPARASRSAKLYSRLWTNEGSPLKVNLEKLVNKLEDRLKNEYMVSGAMRYGNPSIRSVILKIPERSDVIVLPLYPQYASATTGSVRNAISSEAGTKFRSLKFIDQFCFHPAFIEVFAGRIKKYKPEDFDHVLFSYHSLPVRQVNKVHPGIKTDQCSCSEHMPEHGTGCYRASCYETSRLIAGKTGLGSGSWSTSFQSAMSKNWIGPFTVQVIKELASRGKKRVLVTAPSFVSDCLETLIEIREEYNHIFRSAGGQELVMVESLNHGDDWVEAIINIITSIADE